MTVQHILATSGGFLATDRWQVMRPGGLVQEALRLTGSERPRVTLVMTASGDSRDYLLRSYQAFAGWSVDLTHLELFPQPNADPRRTILTSDVVWVGGGSVANLLALWRVHGLDEVMREAWEAGVLLAGVSAGSICWHVGGTTDSFGPELRPVTDGLALLPYGNGVHYDSEERRRPLLHALVADGTLPLSFATDDGVGVLYEGVEPVEVITDDPARQADQARRPSSATTPPAAYRVEKLGAEVVETRLPVGPV
jgi:peptidase E